MKKLLQSLFVLLFFAFNAIAQDRTINGTVTSTEEGFPLPGVSVKLIGSQGVVATDASGKYSIKITSATKSIQFSYLGYVTKTVNIAASNTINVGLASDSQSLSDVVVVAYGTSKKEAIVGSVAKIGTADIEKRTVTNATMLLAGSTPGVATTSGNGQPGSSATIRLRGFGSFSAGNGPLIVLDGSQYDGSIGDINVNDIESMSILKDASSSALYGSRAANGVIIITTKRGSLNKSSLNVNFNQGFSERGTKEFERLDAYQYYPAMWQAVKNNLMFTGVPNQTDAVASQNASNTIKGLLNYNPFNVADNAIVGTDGLLNPNAALKYDDFDWFGAAARTGKRSDVNMSYSGKNDKTDYFVSLGYLKDQGYIIKSDMQRFSGRINVNTQVKPWLKTGLNLSASFSDLNNAYDSSTDNAASFNNIFSFTRGMGPIYPVHAYDASGNRIYNPITKADWYDYGQHPGAVIRPTGASNGRHVIYETMLNDNMSKRNNIGGRTYVDVKFLKDFTFTPSINVDIRNNVNSEYRNPLVGDGAGVAGSTNSLSRTTKSYTFNQILNYKKSVNNHNFTATLGHENYNYTTSFFSGTKNGQILLGNTEFANFVTPMGVSGYKDTETIESYFSKATYNYNEKYFLEASIRRDGSARFSAENRWGTFYSFGGSWNIAKEKFLENESWINDLRLKASYGEVGNNTLSSYYGYQALYDLGYNNGTEAGALLATLATPELKWEKSKTFNTGLAFSLFNKKIYGELEYFKRGSSELIFSVPQPLSDPVASKNANVGSMDNRGWELQLGTDLIRTQDFSWNIVTNWTMFTNKITKMPVETPTIISGTKKREVGKDFYSFWLRQYAGVDPKDGSSLYIPADGTAAANIRTVNGVDYVTSQTFAKFDYSGSAIPDLMGSVSSTFGYKAFSFSFLLNYQIGGKFYDSVYQGLMSPAYGGALHADAANSWSTTNTTSSIPRLDIGNTTNINATSSRWLVDASYLSLTNVNFSYKLPKSLLDKIDVAGAKIFVTGENLGLISKRQGLDPRQAFDGVNTTVYVPSRVLSFGINLSL